jgi:hypothetical protein
VSHRRKKKDPSVPSNPQPKKFDGQGPQEFQTSTAEATRDGDSDEHRDGSQNQQTDAWYCRWLRYLKESWDSNGIVAIGTILLGIVGIGSLVLTKLSLDESRQSLRPYVSIGRKDGVIAEFIPTGDPQASIGIRLYMQNGGQSPALNPTIGLQIQLMYKTNLGVLHPDEPEDSYQGKPDNFEFIMRSTAKDTADSANATNASGTSIPPQAEYYYDSLNKVSPKQLQLLRKGYRFLMMMGMLQYCDDLGNYTCRRFMLSYGGGTDTAFNLGSESDCSAMYTYSGAQPGQHYLLPCEQPKEREAREKWEYESLVREAAEANAKLSAAATSSPSRK